MHNVSTLGSQKTTLQFTIYASDVLKIKIRIARFIAANCCLIGQSLHGYYKAGQVTQQSPFEIFSGC